MMVQRSCLLLFLCGGFKSLENTDLLTYIVLLGLGFVVAFASMILLKFSLVIYRATRSWDVPILSRVRDWILEMWTPISR